MKLVTFRKDGQQKIGALIESGVVDLSAVAGTMIGLVQAGSQALHHAREVMAGGMSIPLAEVVLDAPLRPGKVLCSGINYRGHMEENPNAEPPEEPFFFPKLPNAVVGPGVTVHPGRSTQLDYEVEFAVVIGATLKDARPDAVMPAIFGYTLLNDISARDIQFKDNQITLGKNLDAFAPIGPCIVTVDEIADPGNVGLRARLNGATVQDGTTADWLFSLPDLVAFLSRIMRLESGDIVTTGTPAGVGYFRSPQVFMKEGDVVEIEADGVGVLRNRIGA